MIKAIIFDVDGVLFHSTDSSGKFLWSRDAKNDLGLTSAHFQNIFSKNWELVLKGTVNTIEYLDSLFKTQNFSDLNLTSSRFIKYWLSKDKFVNEEMIKLIKTIKIPKYIATNQESHRLKQIENLVGQDFCGIFASCELGYMKPEDEFYLCIENELNIPGNQILFIDDMLSYVDAANKRGWLSYHYQNDLSKLVDFTKKHLVI